jgi:hypothetical protein
MSCGVLTPVLPPSEADESIRAGRSQDREGNADCRAQKRHVPLDQTVRGLAANEMAWPYALAEVPNRVRWSAGKSCTTRSARCAMQTTERAPRRRSPIPADAKPVPWDTDYRFTGFNKFLDIDGYPAVAPPWGTLNAINMNTGEYAWKVPLGAYPELAAMGMKNTGSENYGGPIVTAGGLVFIAATLYDNKFRAFEKTTGKLVWETTLPFQGDATPATYAINGRQYIVIATSNGRPGPAQRALGALKAGGSYVAFALPAGFK